MKQRLIKQQHIRQFPAARRESSTYWGWLSQQKWQRDRPEFAQANPDTLAERSGFYAVTEEQQEKAEAVRELFKNASQYLTELQFKVFMQMTEGKSLRFIGRAMGLNTSTVRESWLATQKKLQKKFQAIYG